MITQDPALLQKYKQLFEYSTEIKAIFDSHGNMLWPKQMPPVQRLPMYLENTGSEAKTVTFRKSNSSAPSITIEMSTDNENWSTLGRTGNTLTYSVSANSRLYLRAQSQGWATKSGNNIYYNSIEWNDKVGGEILSLIYGEYFEEYDTFPFVTSSKLMFPYLFYVSIYTGGGITDAQKLVLPNDCKQYCYAYMFGGCTELEHAPIFPAQVLESHCYEHLFDFCSKINYIKCLATENINETNLYYWTASLDNTTGTFVKVAGTTWPTGISGIPQNWTVVEV